MTDDGYRITSQREGPGVGRLSLVGEFDMANEAELTTALLDLVRDPAVDHVVVDVRGTTYLGSSGLHALLVGYHAARDAGKRFGVANLPGMIKRVFDLAEVTEVLRDD